MLHSKQFDEVDVLDGKLNQSITKDELNANS